MLRRILAGFFGAILFAVLLPIGYFLIFDDFLIEGLTGVAFLAGLGAVVGAALGARFPRIFGFFIEIILDSIS
jgi:hypothetical protein